MLTLSIRRKKKFAFRQTWRNSWRHSAQQRAILVKSRIKQHPLSFSLVTSQTLLPPLFLCFVPCAMFCTAGRVAACILHSRSGSWCVTLVGTNVYGRIKVSQPSCGPKQIVTSFCSLFHALAKLKCYHHEVSRKIAKSVNLIKHRGRKQWRYFSKQAAGRSLDTTDLECLFWLIHWLTGL